MTVIQSQNNDIETIGMELLSNFLKLYGNRNYSLHELLYFAYQKGREFEKDERERISCIENNASAYLSENGEIHNN